jgi:hypothetical protein
VAGPCGISGGQSATGQVFVEYLGFLSLFFIHILYISYRQFSQLTASLDKTLFFCPLLEVNKVYDSAIILYGNYDLTVLPRLLTCGTILFTPLMLSWRGQGQPFNSNKSTN